MLYKVNNQKVVYNNGFITSHKFGAGYTSKYLGVKDYSNADFTN